MIVFCLWILININKYSILWRENKTKIRQIYLHFLELSAMTHLHKPSFSRVGVVVFIKMKFSIHVFHDIFRIYKIQWMTQRETTIYPRLKGDSRQFFHSAFGRELVCSSKASGEIWYLLMVGGILPDCLQLILVSFCNPFECFLSVLLWNVAWRCEWFCHIVDYKCSMKCSEDHQMVVPLVPES